MFKHSGFIRVYPMYPWLTAVFRFNPPLSEVIRFDPRANALDLFDIDVFHFRSVTFYRSVFTYDEVAVIVSTLLK